jgi:hypothetical protein
LFPQLLGMAKCITNLLAQLLVVPRLGQKLVDRATIDGTRHQLKIGVTSEDDTDGLWILINWPPAQSQLFGAWGAVERRKQLSVCPNRYQRDTKSLAYDIFRFVI